MLTTPDIHQSLLQYMKVAVLERLAPMTYQIIGKPPAFYLKLFPPEQNGLPCAAPWKHSFMLEDFLTTADFF